MSTNDKQKQKEEQNPQDLEDVDSLIRWRGKQETGRKVTSKRSSKTKKQLPINKSPIFKRIGMPIDQRKEICKMLQDKRSCRCTKPNAVCDVIDCIMELF